MTLDVKDKGLKIKFKNTYKELERLDDDDDGGDDGDDDDDLLSYMLAVNVFCCAGFEATTEGLQLIGDV